MEKKKEFFGKIGCYDLKTGEALEEEDLKKVMNEKNSWYYKNLIYKFYNSAHELDSKDIKIVASIINKGLDLKKYEPFDLYSTTNSDLFNKAVNELSETAFCSFCKMLNFSNSKNTLQFKNNKNIVKDLDFIEILKISRTKWFDVKKELIDYGAIRKVKFDGKNLYKINPSIIGHSMDIDIITYYAFRDILSSMFDPMKTLYWDKQLIESCGSDIFYNRNKNKYYSDFIKVSS